jgi:outer membrane protein OmpA-like peptidoglycan-associated protein
MGSLRFEASTYLEAGVRRISSLFISLAMTAAGVAITVQSVSAAPGDVTRTTSPTATPASISGAISTSIVRLAGTDSFLAMGRDTSVAGSHQHLWKIKSDLTIDTTFGAVDLGVNFAAPTSANSGCASNSASNCSNFSMVANETLGQFMAVGERGLKGTSGLLDRRILSLSVGSLSTGTITATSMFLGMVETTSGDSASNYSAYTTNELGKDQCTAGIGATKNGATLRYAWLDSYGVQIRPDGSVIVPITCSYSTWSTGSQATVLREYESEILVGLKASGGALVPDTSFGANGRVIVFDSLTSCLASGPPSSTVDMSITSVDSAKPYMMLWSVESPVSTTMPTGGGYQNTGFSSYEGCPMGVSSSSVYTMKITPMKANGDLMTTQTVMTGGFSYVMRWIIDSNGRWNALVSEGMGMTPTYKAIRLANGLLDTTLGTNGQKAVTNLPSTVVVNGTNVNIRYNISGYVTSASDVYFVGLASSSTGSFNCSGSTTVTQTYYAFQLSFDTGLITSYGTNGLGTGASLEVLPSSLCNMNGMGGSIFVDSTGRPGYVAQTVATGSQTAGLVSFKWDPATGVTGGGDGSGFGATAATTTTTTVAPTTVAPTTVAPTTTTTIAPTTTTIAPIVNRVDAKVYSRQLPKAVQPDTALRVISTADADDLDLRVTTPRICVALTTSVLMVNKGRCVVQVIDEETKKVLRTLSTTVKTARAKVGSVLTTDEPIMFKRASISLTRTAKAQIAELALAANGASRIAVLGHAAALSDASQFSYAISRGRAEAVKAALVQAGVKATIEIVALSALQPEQSKKTESAQAKNRRVEVFIFPS